MADLQTQQREPRTETIAERFTRETANHEMTILHNDGMYRHLHFQSRWWQPPLLKQQTSSMYWFDLITVPGTLIFQGDGESFVFSRIEDMFAFFRGSRGQINPGYWAQKLTSRHDQAMKYDEDLLKARALEDAAEAVRQDPTLTGLADAVRDEIFEADEIGYEAEALRIVSGFRFYKNEADRYDSRKRPDFQFHDVWEWDCRDHDWWFLWACHAIVWGIAQYDEDTNREVAP